MIRLHRHTTLAMLALASLGIAQTADAHDELYYSAAACVPVAASHFNGSGAQGLQFTNVGSWANYDSNETQILVCPVPYARDTGNLASIVARVVIDDRHWTSFARAYLCGRDTSGGQSCVTNDNFPTVVGNSTIELSLTPAAGTRFVWIEVHIPDNETANPFSGVGTSEMIGYRIFRN